MDANSVRVGVDFAEFKKQILSQQFSKEQMGPLNQRLLLLDDFLNRYKRVNLNKTTQKILNRVWDFEPGTLTIVDLSCPFVSPADACSLFTVALSIFLETRGTGESRIIALDEAHKVWNALTNPTCSHTDPGV